MTSDMRTFLTPTRPGDHPTAIRARACYYYRPRRARLPAGRPSAPG